ncbi:MAG TPA: saccharopine dehydrogenase NADP-binding domain-containing protein [Ramlibacter sp.]|nr:saccharopine dehydrogenase NADP-binding domain-containing protein [Ramlibacter sp.]
MPKSFDLIVFGATGFTGRLVAEFLNKSYGVGKDVNWAIAGRNRDKLIEVRDQIGASSKLPLLTADASDSAALDTLVSQAKVIITTVGPYQRHGEPLITACARNGSDYVDLCGEPAWMAKMIPLLQQPAQASGARIVFSCGFDSIPFDLGVVFLQAESQRRFGVPMTRVRGRVKVIKGGPSGGTIASGMATFEEMGRNPTVARTMADAFALTPGFRGPAQPDTDSATYDDKAKSWTAPFVMAAINTKNVHRTNALRGHPWGTDFIYDERMMTGDGALGHQRAKAMSRATRVQNMMLGFAPARAVLSRFVLPKPGEGPTQRQRETGHYEVLFIGETANGQVLKATVKGDRDPGYGSTSKMITESALCLLHDVDRSEAAGGVWTAGAAMGLALVRRLEANAGLSFSIEE